jgi:hypothetical protein
MFLCRPCRLLALCCALLPLCLPLGGSTAPAEEYDGRRAADVRSLAAAAQISPAAKQARPTATPTPPAGEQTARAQGLPAALFADNPRLPTQILAFCAVFLYFFLLWRRLGADPPKGIIAPRTQPPPAPVTDKATAVAPLPPSPRTICATPPASAAGGWPPPFWIWPSAGSALSVRRRTALSFWSRAPWKKPQPEICQRKSAPFTTRWSAMPPTAG